MASSNSLLVSFSILFFIIISFLPTNNARVNVTDFINQILDGHNTARQAVGVPPLTYDLLLARVARVYANERRHDCNNTFSTGTQFGETIFTRTGNSWTVVDAIASWASQADFYNHETNTCDAAETCSDYTQMVWKDTRRVGCSQIKCDIGDTYIICEYYPRGNFIGQKPF